MYVRKNDLRIIVQDNQQYVGEDMVQYPRTWDKSTISELAKVAETERPTDSVIIGSHIELIDDVYTQVWDTREYTDEEIEQHRKDGILTQISTLEMQITPRREREAILTGDYSFIQDIDTQITLLREQLNANDI